MLSRKATLNREVLLKKMADTLLNALGETLENMAFTEVEAVGLPSPDATETSPEGQPGEVLWVSLLVHNPIQGEFRLAMPKTLIQKVAETIYVPAEGSVSDKQLYDTMGEILNTVAGRFMGKFLREEQTFQLGLPEIGSGKVPEPETASAIWNFRTEGEAFSVVVSGESFLQMRRAEDYD